MLKISPGAAWPLALRPASLQRFAFGSDAGASQQPVQRTMLSLGVLNRFQVSLSAIVPSGMFCLQLLSEDICHGLHGRRPISQNAHQDCCASRPTVVPTESPAVRPNDSHKRTCHDHSRMVRRWSITISASGQKPLPTWRTRPLRCIQSGNSMPSSAANCCMRGSSCRNFVCGYHDTAHGNHGIFCSLAACNHFIDSSRSPSPP